MKHLFVTILLTGVLIPSTFAQGFSDDDRLRGYAFDGATLTFIFDGDVYGLTHVPDQVVVTGSFAGWSQDMSDSSRVLVPTGGSLWLLAVDNTAYASVPPSSEFKFRIDDGVWLDPPQGAVNVSGGNLVFAQGVEPLRLRAEISGPRSIRAYFSGDDFVRPLDPASYTIRDAGGRGIAVEHIAPNTQSETLVIPAEDLDVRRVYYLDVEGMPSPTLCRRDAWFQNIYSSKQLGANFNTDDSTTSFRIFAPRAERIRLFLYDGPNDSPDQARAVHEMVPDRDGVWEASVEGNLSGTYYDFTVHGPPDPGNFFYETHPVHISDPYSRANVDSFGKSRVMPAMTPASPLANGRPPMKDVVAYEVHVQDFTDRLPVPADEEGTFPAMTTPGLTNSHGEPIGFDHLVDMGINVVHLMPVQEYLHYPDDEWRAAFENDPYMIEQGVNLENYQWGYRTTHAFAIENRFRKKGTDYGDEREQFRDLIQKFHEAGIAVIIDIVPNHTGENMDGRHYLFNFNALDKPYYYRTNERLEHIGPFGNEVKTESRPMVQRWVIDQCVDLIDEFGFDGFRIDLAGQIDEQTLIALRKAVGDDIIIYGEPWIAPSDPDVRANPDWAWYKEDAPITYFQDAARNAFKGPVSNPQDPIVDRGYPGGHGSVRNEVMLGLANRFDDERDPDRAINYLDIHDNWALADRFATTDWDGRHGVEEARYKLAATLLFTSLGPVVIHGGSEFMRSKGHAPLEEIIKTTASGELHYHGKRDTYNLRRANQFVWENLGTSREEGAANNYDNMYRYWRGLIGLRMSDAGSIFRIANRPPDDYYRWILPDDTRLLGYVVAGNILVLMNTTGEDAVFADLPIDNGNWQLVANGIEVNHVDGVDAPFADIGPGRSVTIPPTVAAIWVKRAQ